MVEWITYKEQKFPFLYNYYVISRLRKVAKEIDENELADYILYYGIEAGCNEVDQSFTIKKGDEDKEFTIKDSAFMLGILTPEKLDDLIKVFVDKTEDVEDKKK